GKEGGYLLDTLVPGLTPRARSFRPLRGLPGPPPRPLELSIRPESAADFDTGRSHGVQGDRAGEDGAERGETRPRSTQPRTSLRTRHGSTPVRRASRPWNLALNRR